VAGDVILVHWHEDECAERANRRRDGPRPLAWPEKSSGQVTDLSHGVVRAFGLDQGLLDTKICALGAIWPGLRFSRRKAAKR
jgi:hypothetical protein